MGHTKIQNDIRNECEKLYVYDSFSVPKISEKMGIKECTIRHWHERQKWEEKRQDFKKKASETLYHRLLGYIEVSVQRYLVQSAIMAQICLEASQKFFSLSVDEREKNIDLMLKFSRLADQSSKVHRNVVPDASEQLSNRILEELKEISSKINGTVIEGTSSEIDFIFDEKRE